MAIVFFSLLFILNIGRTGRAIFYTWPANDEVQFVWQEALTDAAEYLDNSPEVGQAAIGGWTPETMDPPTMELTLKREDLRLRYFDPGRAVIVPDEGLILHPTALPLHPVLLAELTSRGVQPEPMGTFTTYDVGSAFSGLADVTPEATFGGEISLLGYDAGVEGDSLDLIAIWRVETPSGAGRRVFVHLLDESGNMLGQDDALGAPAAHWQTGDIIIQRHTIMLPAPAEAYQVRLGVYDPGSGVRLLTSDGADSLFVSSTTVQ